MDKISGKTLSTFDYTLDDKMKLGSISPGANNYVHPANHPPSIIAQDTNNMFVSNTEKNRWNNTYTKSEVDSQISTLTSGLDWKESVTTFNDLAVSYPSPQDGWTVNVKDTDITYRYTGSKWIAISSNAIPVATSSVNGLMSSSDKSKLDGVQAGAQVNTVSSVAGKTGSVSLTKADVGLGNLENYIVATKVEAEAGVASDKYMTPLRVKEAITAQTSGLGSGDMLKSIYDANGDGKVNSADVADSVSWAGVTGKPLTFSPADHSHTAVDLPSATTSVKGVVQLSTSTTSTSSATAATSSAVKTVADSIKNKSKLVVGITAPDTEVADIWFQEI